MTIDPTLELARLSKALDERQKAIDAADAWYSGDHPTPEPPPNTAAAVDFEARAAFDAMSRQAVTNLLPPIADTPARKLHPQGWRFSESENSTDAEAWVTWQRSGMEAQAEELIPAITQKGSACLLVWPGRDGRATITVEDPAQTIVSYRAGSGTERRSALKRWVDEDGHLNATLYLPGEVYKWRSRSATATSAIWTPGAIAAAGVTWDQRMEQEDTEWPVRHDLGVPMVEVAINTGIKARPFGGGKPAFHGQLNEQRKLNSTVMGALVTAEYQAFRQRWVTGWDYPTLEDGTPDRAAIHRASAARLFTFPTDAGLPDGFGGHQEIKVGEFAQADFRPFIDLMLTWVKFMAATSGTPPYAFLLGDMVNVAADSLARIDGVHITNVRALSRAIGHGLVEALRLALLVDGSPKAADPVITTVWGEFEQRTGKEQADMALAAHELGAPDEAVFAMFPGVDAAEAARWAQAARAQRLFGDLVLDDPGGPEAG